MRRPPRPRVNRALAPADDVYGEESSGLGNNRVWNINRRSVRDPVHNTDAATRVFSEKALKGSLKPG